MPDPEQPQLSMSREGETSLVAVAHALLVLAVGACFRNCGSFRVTHVPPLPTTFWIHGSCVSLGQSVGSLYSSCLRKLLENHLVPLSFPDPSHSSMERRHCQAASPSSTQSSVDATSPHSSKFRSREGWSQTGSPAKGLLEDKFLKSHRWPA